MAISKAEYLNNLLELEKRKARKDYYTFLKLMSPPEFLWNWHHEYVCKVLQEWLLTNHFPNLMIFMPPQHQKSTMMTEYLPAWSFGQNPNYQSLLVMANSTMAKKYNRKIQRIMQRDKYMDIFPNAKLNEKNVVTTAKGAYVKNSEEFEIVGARGFLKSVGVDGMIAGNPAKLSFIDDVIKNQAQANSDTYRENVYEWYVAELEARQHNDSKIAFTITRRHDDDLAGRLLLRDGKIEDGGKWKVVVLPALRETMDDPNDPREIGEPLFPNLHNRERMEKKKKDDPDIFESLYQQNPTAKGGNMIKGDWFTIMNEKEVPFDIDQVTWDAFIDGAYTEKVTNDETAIAYTYFDKYDNILYIRRVTSFRKKLTAAIEYIKREFETTGVDDSSSIFIEMKSSGHAFYDLLWNDGYNCIEIDNETVKIGKKTRVISCEPKLRSGRVVLIEGNWTKAFKKQCEGFPKTKHDDMVDVLCYSIFEYMNEGVNPYIKM